MQVQHIRVSYYGTMDTITTVDRVKFLLETVVLDKGIVEEFLCLRKTLRQGGH
ncbi:Protein of unknown function [Pyronema omphalodes CBS 100304]|uniref:Uncharacterized protein n=1 Tax=Pyronema omphalodes (strain CBS 100304) TaxID=1076935 RepID=U4LNT4_PYROM|nr:Protein of unknown function [Pyronema omphalodes CBS 100304]